MSSAPVTRARFDDDRTVLSDGVSTHVALRVAAINIATHLFLHDPPTPGEIEQAIDLVEDALAATGLKQTARGDLVIENPMFFEQLGLPDEIEKMTREQVEERFQRLASISLGRPRTHVDPPTKPMAAALLLILRECMHHLGYGALVSKGNDEVN